MSDSKPVQYLSSIAHDEDFFEDLNKLALLEGEYREHAIAFISGLSKIKTQGELSDFKQNYLNVFGLDARDSLSVINTLYYLYSRWRPDLTAKIAFEDLQETVERWAGEDFSLDVSLLNDYLVEVDKCNSLRVARAVGNRVLPTFKFIDSVVEKRPVFRSDFVKNFDYENDEDVVVDFVNLAIVQLCNDEDDQLFMQLNADMLDTMEKEIAKLKQQLRLLEK